MWDAIEQMAVMLVLALLKVIIKSPKSVTREKATIAQLAMLSTEADAAVNGTSWTSAPATPPAAA